MSSNNNKGYKRRPQERKRQRATEVTILIKNLPASAMFDKKHRFDPWVRKTPCKRAWPL